MHGSRVVAVIINHKTALNYSYGSKKDDDDVIIDAILYTVHTCFGRERDKNTEKDKEKPRKQQRRR